MMRKWSPAKSAVFEKILIRKIDT